MKTSDPLFNIKFVEAVERKSCLWNFTLPEYSKREVLEKAWNEVAKEMSDTVPNCQTRWKSIRRAFSRSLKPSVSGSGAASKKSYYLAKKLEFLIPYIRNCSSTGNLTGGNAEDNIAETDLNATNNDEVLLQDLSVNTAELSEEKPQEVSGQNENSKNKSRKQRQKDNNNEIDSVFLEWMQAKKAKSTGSTDHNMLFLQSLTPFLNEMTSKQNRRFRQKVMKLIDDILEDTDIAQEIRPVSAMTTCSSFELGSCSSVQSPAEVSGDNHFSVITTSADYLTPTPSMHFSVN